MRGLVDVANRVCWHCDVKTHMTPVEGSHRYIDQADSSNRVVMGTLTCDECKWHSLAFGMHRSAYSPSADDMWAILDDPELWLPEHGSGKTFGDVPSHIAEAASEAHSCHSISAYRASTLMARSVIEATAKEKGVVNGTLFKKIDALAELGLLRAHIKAAAHEIRHFGNDMAHGDFISPVIEEESTLVLTLMGEVLDDVFQSPARVKKAMAARAAKQTGTP